jgi:hypothetical protein
MQLPIVEASVTTVLFDFAISLNLNAASIRIETLATVERPGIDSLTVEPESPGEGATEFVRLRGLVVKAASTADNGELTIEFDDGTHLVVPPNDHYEAWTFAGEHGEKAVCLPGGELTTWGLQNS